MKVNKHPRQRTLRSYERIAHEWHNCTHCYIPIMPGERYGANVIVCGKKLWVEKFHVECPPNPEDEYQEMLASRHKRAQPNPFITLRIVA